MNEVWRTRWLASAALLALGHGSAWAQTAAPATPTPRERMTGADHASDNRGSAATAAPSAPRPLGDTSADAVLGDQAFYMEADSVIRDDQAKTWTARGSVEARYRGRTLRANEVVYNLNTGVVTARGDAQMINADGTAEFAEAMTVDKDFKAGVAVAFSTRLTQNAKLAAAEAIRRNQDTLELNKAIFTPCAICAPDGRQHQPTWSIQAAQIIQDHKRQVVFYRHAVVRVMGLPVLATPFFWHADPQAVRKSGFLAPDISIDGRRGFTYSQPYLWVISPSQDLILDPMISTKVNPFLSGEYRKRFYSGEIDARFGYTFDHQFDGKGKPYDNATSRSFILADGAFAPTANWTYGFSAERVTDPLLFQRYSIANVYAQRGLYSTDDQRLLSQIYAVEQDQRSYISIAALSFQGLRAGDANGTFPVVGPLVEARFEPDAKILGGRLRLLGDGVILTRDRSTATDKSPGTDSRRATGQVDWRSITTLSNGIRLEPFVQGRGDVYNVSDLTPTDHSNRTVARALGTAGVDASWPFFRRDRDLSLVLEPLVQLALSPDLKTNANIPNEDSVAFDLNESNLFTANKSVGFDLYEGGQRLNVGGRATFRWDSGGSAQLLVGRSFRAKADPSLPGSLGRTASDWVVAGSAQPITQLSAFARALYDSDSGNLDRLEAGVNVYTDPVIGFLRYLKDDIALSNGLKTENFQAGGQVLVTKHWGLVGSANWDIAGKVWVREELGLLYQDDCTHLEIVYQHDGVYDRTLHPSDKVIIRLTLATLGISGYQRSDYR